MSRSHRIARYHEELSAALGHAAAAGEEADAATRARAELEAEMGELRRGAEAVGLRLEEHARDGEAEEVAATRERGQLAEALWRAATDRDLAEQRAAEAEARAAAAEGERDGVASRAAAAAARAEAALEVVERDAEAAASRTAATAADTRTTRADALSLKAELDAARCARDDAYSELRGERAARALAEARAADADGARESFNTLTAEAEAALARASAAERDAAAEVLKLRSEARELSSRVRSARAECESRTRHRDIAGVIAELDATEREVLQKAEQSSLTMAGLESSVKSLAARLSGSGRGGAWGEGAPSTPDRKFMMTPSGAAEALEYAPYERPVSGRDGGDALGGSSTWTLPPRYPPPSRDAHSPRQHATSSTVGVSKDSGVREYNYDSPRNTSASFAGWGDGGGSAGSAGRPPGDFDQNGYGHDVGRNSDTSALYDVLSSSYRNQHQHQEHQQQQCQRQPMSPYRPPRPLPLSAPGSAASLRTSTGSPVVNPAGDRLATARQAGLTSVAAVPDATGLSSRIKPAARSLFPSSTDASQSHRSHQSQPAHQPHQSQPAHQSHQPHQSHGVVGGFGRTSPDRAADLLPLRPLTLTHSSAKSAPWFPDAAYSANSAVCAGAGGTGPEAGVGVRARAEGGASSEIAKAAHEAHMAVEAARARRDAREKNAKVSRENYYRQMATHGGGSGGDGDKGGGVMPYGQTISWHEDGGGASLSRVGGHSPTGSAYLAAKTTSCQAESAMASARAAEAAQPAEWQLRLSQIEAENVFKLGQIETENSAMKDRIHAMAADARRVNAKLDVYGDVDNAANTPGPRAGAPPSPVPLWR